MKVYDKRQDHEENLFHQLYEGLIGGMAKLLENNPRDEAATRTDVSSPLQNPNTRTWQTVNPDSPWSSSQLVLWCRALALKGSTI
jgi:hypothetical protein